MLKEFHPAKKDILDGVVVLIDPFRMGMSMMILASGMARAPIDDDLNPLEADWYINVYQWTLRFLSL